ncbi:hypothetical protein [Hahella sp. NBU794]|uniref:hypothetical protein n=1 Tax=Hahella sp. NBU794 TaxID=3422590 RepID=UPI003D6FD6F7
MANESGSSPTLITEHGDVYVKKGKDAALQLIREMESYADNLTPTQSYAETLSMWGAVGAIATTVGTMSSIIGLKKKGVVNEFELEIINHSSYTIAPFQSKSDNFGFQQAVRPLVPGETGSIKAKTSGFQPGKSHYEFTFMIGSNASNCVDVHTTIELRSSGVWRLNHFYIDGRDLWFNEDGYRRAYLGFAGKDDYASFSLSDMGADQQKGKVSLFFSDYV